MKMVRKNANFCGSKRLYNIDQYIINRISTNGDTSYSQACRFLNLKQHPHSQLEESIIERKMHYIKAGQYVSMITFHLK